MNDDLNLQILSTLKNYGECETKFLAERFREFETRKELSAFLGNMNREGLIVKSNPAMWSLTSKGRDVLDNSGYPLHGVPKEFVVPAGKLKETANSDEAKRVDPWAMVRQLQHIIPNGSSLVVEADEIFVVWRGARFSIQSQDDLNALSVLNAAYVDEVA
ncbi:hypothetical protein [Cycloclasticus pugetii]|uniref:hypothetical protein n=1 Tax=Cycloclasticus pugetii TaxID=34068 RepID=UPI003A8E867E